MNHSPAVIQTEDDLEKRNQSEAGSERKHSVGCVREVNEGRGNELGFGKVEVICDKQDQRTLIRRPISFLYLFLSMPSQTQCSGRRGENSVGGVTKPTERIGLGRLCDVFKFPSPCELPVCWY